MWLLSNCNWLPALLFLAATSATAQPKARSPRVAASTGQAAGPAQWHLQDPELDKVPGIGATRAYVELLANRKATPVLVAVIDSGVDTAHADLKPALWRNPREVAGNGRDDDKNGYVDDVHGWNFLGGPDGRSILDESLEMTRIVAVGRSLFRDKSAGDIPASQRAAFELYQKAEAMYLAEAKQEMAGSPSTSNALNLQHYNSRRIAIVKDNPTDLTERYYGNADVHGPNPTHGTHVAGIIAALRDNDLGAQGVAGPWVRIMAIRVVPEGDERDKDVANAIRYAVDNGAQIINMSFGKALSPEQQAVEAAIQYAAQKNVLLVHAAGNDHNDLAVNPYYPTAHTLADGQPFPNLLTVGASGPSPANLAAAFSNYGQKLVDVFAPGVSIYSTLPGSVYGNQSGTSMAAPVTAGVAAVLKSYFPTLTAAELKRIIMQSAQVQQVKVTVPGTRRQADFTTLSLTGGIVNLYEAVKLAQILSK